MCIEVANIFSSCAHFAIVGSLVYLDASFFRSERLSQVCGFLVPVALPMILADCWREIAYDNSAILLPISCLDWSATAVHWATNILWAVTSSFYLGSEVLGLTAPSASVSVTCWLVLLSVHNVLPCSMASRPEIVARSFIFYVFCMLYYYGRSSYGDRELLAYVTPHLSMHILYVERTVMLGSVVVFVGVLAYEYLHRGKACAKNPTKKTTSSVADTATELKSPQQETSEMLLKQLRQAQNFKTSV